MYDEDYYYEEPQSDPNEPLMALIVMVGGFILMMLVLYLKFQQGA